jgi:hypothetical protein
MPASSPRRWIVPGAAIITLAVVLAVLGSGALGRSATPSPSPAAPSPVPSAPAATPEPSAPEGEGVVIDDPSGHVITVDVDDRSGAVTGVTSARPTVGMSVRWSEAIVENVDDHTIRVTWAGFPRDEDVVAVVERGDAGVAIGIGQGMPYPNTDAMGQDRILVFTFDQAVDASDVAVAIHPADSLGS